MLSANITISSPINEQDKLSPIVLDSLAYAPAEIFNYYNTFVKTGAKFF